MFDPGRAPGSFYYGGTAGLLRPDVPPLRRPRREGARADRAHDGRVRDRGAARALLPRRCGRACSPDASCGMVGTRGVHGAPGRAGRRSGSWWRAGRAASSRTCAACLDHVAAVALLRENYFWSVYIRGRYTRDACPGVPEGGPVRPAAGRARGQRPRRDRDRHRLPRARDGAVHRVRAARPHGLDGAPPGRCCEDEWRRIFARAAPGARVIFRSGARDATFLPAGGPRAPGVRHRARGAPPPARPRGHLRLLPHRACPRLRRTRPRASAWLRSTASIAGRRRSTTGRGRSSCSAAREAVAGPRRAARATACSTSAAGPAGAPPRLAAAGARVTGVEPSEPMRGAARARAPRARARARPYGTHDGYRAAAERVLFSYSLSMIPPFGT